MPCASSSSRAWPRRPGDVRVRTHYWATGRLSERTTSAKKQEDHIFKPKSQNPRESAREKKQRPAGSEGEGEKKKCKSKLSPTSFFAFMRPHSYTYHHSLHTISGPVGPAVGPTTMTRSGHCLAHRNRREGVGQSQLAPTAAGRVSQVRARQALARGEARQGGKSSKASQECGFSGLLRWPGVVLLNESGDCH